MGTKKTLADPLARLERIISLLKLVAGAKIEHGDLTTPDGTPYKGFKVTIGGIQDPSTIKRSYDDIERIFKSNEATFKVTEEHTTEGKFKSYIVET